MIYRLLTFATPSSQMIFLTVVETMTKTAKSARVVGRRLYMAMPRVERLFLLDYSPVTASSFGCGTQLHFTKKMGYGVLIASKLLCTRDQGGDCRVF